MDGDHVRFGHPQGHRVERDVVQIGGEAAKKESVAQLREAGARRVRVVGSLVVGGKFGNFLDCRRRSDQGVVICLVELCERANEVADVGSNAEIRDAAGIQDDAEGHRCS